MSLSSNTYRANILTLQSTTAMLYSATMFQLFFRNFDMQLRKTKTKSMNVTITGSLGHIGKPLAQELVQKGISVTVISSNPEKQADIESIGAIAAIGSLRC